MSTPRPVDDLSERFVEEYVALDPITATYLGIPGHDDRLPDLSPDGYAAREALTARALADVTAATPTDEREAVARDAFVERLGLDREMAEAGLLRSEFSVISSGLHEIRMAFDLMPTEGEEAWAAIDARLAAIPQTLADYRVTLLEEADRGRVSARRQYTEVATQIRNWTGQEGDSGDLLAALVAGCDVDGALRGDLERHAADASAAFSDFGGFLTGELAPRGREKEAVGLEHYALASRHFLGATVDLAETYAWGWEELKRLDDDMTATAHRIVPGASVAEAVAALDADPARRVEGKETFRDWMQELADRTIEEMAGVHFDIPDPIRRIECCIAPANDGGDLLHRPVGGLHAPGPDVVVGARRDHHLLAVARGDHRLPRGRARPPPPDRADRLPRRPAQPVAADAVLGSGHGEGWALYAERLMDELGYLDDPADRLGMLRRPGVPGGTGDRRHRHAPGAADPDRRTRSASTPARPGRPTSGWSSCGSTAGWTTRSSASRSTATSAGRARRRRTRSASGSGSQARDDARARQGADFDLKAFHRAALDLGSIGLDPLTAALARL